MLHLICNVDSSAFGFLQILNQGYIFQDVSLRDQAG